MNGPAKSIRRLAVIGTAGRGDDALRVTPELYAQMARTLRGLVEQLGSVECLVSGGAAVSDHLAVGFFLKGLSPTLSVHLPALYSHSAGAYVEPYKKSPGSISNYWHRRFSDRCHGNSLRALGEAMRRPGCASKVHYGFEARNDAIADEADGLVAFTFGSGAALKRGGSWHTMSRALRRSIPTWHVDLNSMQIYSPAAPSPAESAESHLATLKAA